MINQTWNISDDERKRILHLHENATKKLYLVREQGEVNPVQGPGTQNVLLDQDENYAYFLSQPSMSVGSDYVDWNKPYLIYARDMEKSYQCKVTEVDKKNRPIKVEVLKNKVLADMGKDEFRFSMTKLSKKDFRFGNGNEITKNSFLYQGKEESGLPLNQMFYGVTYRNGSPITVMVATEGPSETWNYPQNNNVIEFDQLETNSTTLFNPETDVFYGKKLGYFSLVLPTLVTSYPMPKGFNKEIPPSEETTNIEPPQAVPLGDKFKDNVSTPTTNEILNDPNFIQFKKFVEGNDMSKFIFDIQSSASKCSAGYKEGNKVNGKWSDDKSTYPDVTVDPQADKNDIGNLNLTKARAQNLKNFLITNIPQLKNAQFRVVAQGSKGTCGTEEENQKMRRVDLTVTKL